MLNKNLMLREFNYRLHDEVDRKEKLLRKNLVNEFQLKLKKKIDEHEEQIRQEKLNLEIEMQKKIKQVLK